MIFRAKTPFSLRGLMLALVAPALALSACGGANGPIGQGAAVSPAGLEVVPLTITSGSTVHRFMVEVAATPAEQSRGMMQRTSIDPDKGMIFPFDKPKLASFWMRNTLIPLDLIFVRADGTIDRVAENAVPHDETPIVSGGEVAAVLELAGGRAAQLGIDENATVRWGSAQ